MNNLIITALGQSLIAKMIAGRCSGVFTKIQLTDHVYQEADIEGLAHLDDVKQEVLVSGVERKSDTVVTAYASIDNLELQTGYYVRALGLFARDSENGNEILFGVAVDNNPDYMPAYSGRTTTGVSYTLNTKVGITDSISIEVDPAATPTIDQMEKVQKRAEENTAAIYDESKATDNALVTIDKTHFCMKKFGRNDCPFVRDSSLKAGCTYLLLFNNIDWTDGIYKMYTNVGNLYALTNTTSANGKIFSTEVSEDRRGIDADPDESRNAMWICESFNNSSTQFKLKNAGSGQYIYNNNGSLAYSSSASDSDNRYAWTLVNRNVEDDVSDTAPYQGTKELHIYTTITSVSDSTKYIRISNGSGVFKFGSTSTLKDGRNGGVYLYRYLNDSYVIDFQDSEVVKINRASDVSYDALEGMAITTSSANKDLITITLPESEISKNYREVIINYEYTTGSRVGFKYQKSDGTERFENNDNFRFPTNTSSKTVAIDSGYQPMKKFFFISFATGSQTTIKSVVFTNPESPSDSQVKTKEYITEPLCTGTEKAKSVLVRVDRSESADVRVFVTNELGKAEPSWKNATEAVRLDTEYVFTDHSSESSNVGGIGIKVIVSANGEDPVYCSSITCKATYDSDEKAAANHTHDTGTASKSGFTKLYGDTSPASNTDGTLTQDALWTVLTQMYNSLKGEISEAIAASDAMILKGTIGTSGATISALPTIYKVGWTYRVITAGIYAGQVCEVGDLIIALNDRNGSGNQDSDWCVEQTNIDRKSYSTTPKIIGWLDDNTPVYRQVLTGNDTSGWDVSVVIGRHFIDCNFPLNMSGYVSRPVSSPGYPPGIIPISHLLEYRADELKVNGVQSEYCNENCKYVIVIEYASST